MQSVKSSALLCFCVLIVADLMIYYSVSIRMFGDLKTTIGCAQRIIEFSKIRGEDELVKTEDKALKEKKWPDQGEISLYNLSLKYHEHLDEILHRLSCNIMPGFKVGVVGSPGSGKSSIV